MHWQIHNNPDKTHFGFPYIIFYQDRDKKKNHIDFILFFTFFNQVKMKTKKKKVKSDKHSFLRRRLKRHGIDGVKKVTDR